MQHIGIMAVRNQYHGMAVFLSQKLSQKPNTIQPYLDNIITNQSAEIRYMKCVLSGEEATNC